LLLFIVFCYAFLGRQDRSDTSFKLLSFDVPTLSSEVREHTPATVRTHSANNQSLYDTLCFFNTAYYYMYKQVMK